MSNLVRKTVDETATVPEIEIPKFSSAVAPAGAFDVPQQIDSLVAESPVAPPVPKLPQLGTPQSLEIPSFPQVQFEQRDSGTTELPTTQYGDNIDLLFSGPSALQEFEMGRQYAPYIDNAPAQTDFSSITKFMEKYGKPGSEKNVFNSTQGVWTPGSMWDGLGKLFWGTPYTESEADKPDLISAEGLAKGQFGEFGTGVLGGLFYGLSFLQNVGTGVAADIGKSGAALWESASAALPYWKDPAKMPQKFIEGGKEFYRLTEDGEYLPFWARAVLGQDMSFSNFFGQRSNPFAYTARGYKNTDEYVKQMGESVGELPRFGAALLADVLVDPFGTAGDLVKAASKLNRNTATKLPPAGLTGSPTVLQTNAPTQLQTGVTTQRQAGLPSQSTPRDAQVNPSQLAKTVPSRPPVTATTTRNLDMAASTAVFEPTFLQRTQLGTVVPTPVIRGFDNTTALLPPGGTTAKAEVFSPQVSLADIGETITKTLNSVAVAPTRLEQSIRTMPEQLKIASAYTGIVPSLKYTTNLDAVVHSFKNPVLRNWLDDLLPDVAMRLDSFAKIPTPSALAKIDTAALRVLIERPTATYTEQILKSIDDIQEAVPRSVEEVFAPVVDLPTSREILKPEISRYSLDDGETAALAAILANKSVVDIPGTYSRFDSLLQKMPEIEAPRDLRFRIEATDDYYDNILDTGYFRDSRPYYRLDDAPSREAKLDYVYEMVVPAGTKVKQLPDGTFAMPRGATFDARLTKVETVGDRQLSEYRLGVVDDADIPAAEADELATLLRRAVEPNVVENPEVLEELRYTAPFVMPKNVRAKDLPMFQKWLDAQNSLKSAYEQMNNLVALKAHMGEIADDFKPKNLVAMGVGSGASIYRRGDVIVKEVPVGVHEDMVRSLHREFDFVKEHFDDAPYAPKMLRKTERGYEMQVIEGDDLLRFKLGDDYEFHALLGDTVKHLDEYSIMPIFKQIEAAARDIYARGFYYSDLHGGNIRVTPDGKVYILDIDPARTYKVADYKMLTEEALEDNIQSLLDAENGLLSAFDNEPRRADFEAFRDQYGAEGGRPETGFNGIMNLNEKTAAYEVTLGTKDAELHRSIEAAGFNIPKFRSYDETEGVIFMEPLPDGLESIMARMEKAHGVTLRKSDYDAIVKLSDDLEEAGFVLDGLRGVGFTPDGKIWLADVTGINPTSSKRAYPVDELLEELQQSRIESMRALYSTDAEAMAVIDGINNRLDELLVQQDEVVDKALDHYNKVEQRAREAFKEARELEARDNLVKLEKSYRGRDASLGNGNRNPCL